ncbi:MAG: trehalase family glycosidase, partial [Candidatus Saccharibacteria bacterium]
NEFWPTLTRLHTNSSETLLGLPNSYVVPADQHGNFRFNEQYYWDSYFIALGLIACGQNQLAENMLENLFYMFERFNMIPNASRLYMTSRSQPPLLTSFILLIYRENNKTSDWLRRCYNIAQDEYINVWLGETHPHWRHVYKGLSRYYDSNVLHDLAEAESGWDMTPRFGRKALDYLPIDLNSLLYKYEIDFTDIAKILGDQAGSEMWQARAQYRKQTINTLLWSKVKHFYFDYDFIQHKLGSIWSLAAYSTLWAGVASEHNALWLHNHLHKFNCTGGLSATCKSIIDFNVFGSVNTQWAHPNGWAPLHYFAIEGLERYGYQKEAEQIAHKWLKTNLDWYLANDEFLEKYNVDKPKDLPKSGVYPTQKGFGWTNAIFAYLVIKYKLIR